MNKINQIREWDDEIHEEFEYYFPYIYCSNFSKEFPITTQLSIQFTISTNFIKNSIFNCADNDDFFGLKILFRSQIEHFLRFNYVFFKWMEQKSDEEARKYLEFNEAREVLESIKSMVSKNRLSNPGFDIEDWQNIINQFPNLRGYSKKEIENETKKYTYKNIIQVLNIINKSDEKQMNFLGTLMNEYSSLSSFVHGGTGSHKEISSFMEENKRMAEYLRICALAFQMAGGVKLFSLLMFFQTDKKYFERSYLTIDRLIKKTNGIE